MFSTTSSIDSNYSVGRAGHRIINSWPWFRKVKGFWRYMSALWAVAHCGSRACCPSWRVFPTAWDVDKFWCPRRGDKTQAKNVLLSKGKPLSKACSTIPFPKSLQICKRYDIVFKECSKSLRTMVTSLMHKGQSSLWLNREIKTAREWSCSQMQWGRFASRTRPLASYHKLSLAV